MILDRANLSVALAASTDQTRQALTHIQVTPDETVGTNGHLMVRVKRQPDPTRRLPDNKFATDDLNDEMPRIDGIDRTRAAFDPITIPSSVALSLYKALKRKGLPCTNWAQLDEVSAASPKEKVRIGHTDLETPQVLQVDRGPSFPDITHIWPREAPKFRIALNAQYLQTILRIFRDAGNCDDNIWIDGYGEAKPMVIRPCSSEARARVDAILMPVRIQEDDQVEIKATRIPTLEVGNHGPIEPWVPVEALLNSKLSIKKEVREQLAALVVALKTPPVEQPPVIRRARVASPRVPRSDVPADVQARRRAAAMKAVETRRANLASGVHH